MKRGILVTGGVGYIGSQLIRDLATDERLQGQTIKIYDNLQRGNHQVLMNLPPTGKYQFIEGDILDRLTLAEAMKDVWAVIHLAAIVKTPISFDHPQWTEQVNHWGTALVVDQAVQAGVERFIYACSASVYGPGGPFAESDRCNPVGPYSVSKLRGEETVMNVGQQRGLKVTSLRLGTVFGSAAGMRFEAAVNRLAYLGGVSKPLVIHGDGLQKRPIVHVSDAANALRYCLHHNETVNKILNVVTENAAILDIVRAVQSFLPDSQIRRTNQDALKSLSFEVTGKQLEALGYTPNFTLERGVGEIINQLTPLRGHTPAHVE